MVHRHAGRIAPAVLALFLVVVAAPAATARISFFDRDAIKGSGDVVTQDVEVPSFDAVRLDGGIDIDIRVGPEQHVSATVDDNLVDNLELEVSDGELRVDWVRQCRPRGKCRLDITVPRLRAVEVNGAGDINVDGLNGKSFAAEINGAGDMELAGRVDEFLLEINGAGDVDAGELIASSVTVDVSGAGDADVHAEESLEATVAGVGDVRYGGDPEHKRIRTPGVGEVRRR